MINIKKELQIIPTKTCKEYFNPAMVYIPVKNNSKFLCKAVVKGEMIEDKIVPVSGQIIAVAVDNKNNYLVIKNDFKEQTSNLKPILISINCQILYINCLNKDPLNNNAYHLLKRDFEKINTTIHYLLDANISKVVFLVASTEEEMIKKLNEITTDKINIQIINDVYPLGYSSLLKKYLHLPATAKLISLDYLLQIYYSNIKHSFKTTHYITCAGTALQESLVIELKNYTILNDILPFLKFKTNDYTILLNNSLCGQEIDIKTVITNDIKTIIFNKKEVKREEICLNCGFCYRICPWHINPLNNVKCPNCGLCNYVCPSKINIKAIGKEVSDDE